MKKYEDDEIFDDEMKEAIDALIKKGIELYKAYNVDRRNRLIKTALDRLFSDAVENMKKDKEYSEEDIHEIDKKLRKFANEYCQKKLEKFEIN
ncbi:MAG: hypothetical protein JXA50_03930 [Deltaproteobacteria bacterium]|nr:hypothetical protein [Deltaproteobacteria bacterium]